jgi:hypothetical protein
MSTTDSPENFALDSFLADIFSEYGKLDYLNVDKDKKCIVIDFKPIGEEESISLDILKYEVIWEENKYYFIIKDAACSKLWIDKIIKNNYIDKRIEIPGIYSMIVTFLL